MANDSACMYLKFFFRDDHKNLISESYLVLSHMHLNGVLILEPIVRMCMLIMDWWMWRGPGHGSIRPIIVHSVHTRYPCMYRRW